MTEDFLRKLPADTLFELMMKSTQELIELAHKENVPEYEAKKKEVQLIQRIILEKRAEFHPGPAPP